MSLVNAVLTGSSKGLISAKLSGAVVDKYLHGLHLLLPSNVRRMENKG